MTVVYVVPQYRVRSSKLRLQSKKFVACFLSDQTRPTNLGAMLVPDFQGALRLFEQSLISATDHCLDGELLAHPLLPSLTHVHVVHHKGKARVFGMLGLYPAWPGIGSSTQKGSISPFLVCTFYTLRTLSLIGFCRSRLFYAIEASAHYKIQCGSGGGVAVSTRESKTSKGSALAKTEKFELGSTNGA
jgi:hypothetical protein